MAVFLADLNASPSTYGVLSSPTKGTRSPFGARHVTLTTPSISIVEFLKSPERFPHSKSPPRESIS